MFSVPELLKATAGRFISGKKDLKIKGISIDSRTIKPQEAFIAIKGNNFDGHDFISEAIKKGASCVIRERESKISNARHNTTFTPHQSGAGFIEVRDTIKALGNIANFQRNKFALPVIAVTGSNGKTTIKEMLAWVLSLKYKVLKNEGTKNNQIGLPLTLLKLDTSYDMAVVELGTNHPGEIEYLSRIASPNIGIIINIGPAHLEYLGDLKGVFREKYTLIENLQNPYLAILNADDSLLKEYALQQAKKPFILSFGIQGDCDFCGSDINMKFARVNPAPRSKGRSITRCGVNFLLNKKHKFSLKTPGCFNIYNALASIAVARVFGLEYNDIRMRLGDFDFPTSRLKLTEFKEIKFIDDTYNSNPLSLKEALGMLANFSCKGRKIFVMGDMLELGKEKELFHYEAGEDVAKVCDIFITVGELSGLSAEAARKNRSDSKNIFRCTSVREAGEILFNRISPKKDDIVLIKGSRAMRMEEIFKSR